MPDRINQDTVTKANQRNPFMGRSPQELDEIIATLERQAGGGINQQIGGALQTIGQGFQGQESVPTFSPVTGEIGAISVGRAAPSQPSGINELIALEKFRLSQEIEKEKSAERKIKLRKAEIELGKTEREAEAQARLGKEFEAQEKRRVGETVPSGIARPATTEVPVAPKALPTGEVPQPSLETPEVSLDVIEQTGQVPAETPPLEFEIEQQPNGTLKRVRSRAFEAFEKRREAKVSARLNVTEALEKGKGAELGKKFGQAARLVGMFRVLNQQFKRVDRDVEGGTGPGAQAMFDLANKRFSPRFLQKRAAPLFPAVAQREEVAIAALPILSGQARYVQSLAQAIKITVPNINKIKPVRDSLIAQSIRNSMTLVFGVVNGFMGAENLRALGIDPNSEVQNQKQAQIVLNSVQLNEAQQAAIEEAIQHVLDAPALGGEDKTPIEKLIDIGDITSITARER
jgi:hypothetical protein